MVGLYTRYRHQFLAWALRKYNLSEEDGYDIFQDAVIAFYENVKGGKIHQLNYTIKTYLFAIAKNLLLNKLKYNQRFKDHPDEFDHLINETHFENDIIVNEKNQFVTAHLEKLGEPCHSILKLFYYDSFSMESIATKLDYKNKDVVKSQKLRCIKELRKALVKAFG
ncbi:sigma-70 family RNA polymerase sigma factor [Fulvivirgaceae bacterium BMA12]|uniref:Sigma-70 family RNA polymerase sigma factor n=1 Tax=Agaribacillus aureus TaxID=3051825 RepID=A0ABT8LEB1_9BACT|nr:sigma-70 family RNA polymerase sigma factor [Fulvivirgaceae bacterium BMA12]